MILKEGLFKIWALSTLTLAEGEKSLISDLGNIEPINILFDSINIESFFPKLPFKFISLSSELSSSKFKFTSISPIFLCPGFGILFLLSLRSPNIVLIFLDSKFFSSISISSIPFSIFVLI